MKRVLITGGAGFIGSNLAQRLHDNYEVIVLDDLSTGLKSNLENLNLKFVEGSILNGKVVDELFEERIDVIVHLAALGSVPRSIAEPRPTFETNVLGTFELLEKSRIHNSHFIFASSSSVYGNNLDSPKNEKSWVSPISPYGASKLSGEAFSVSYANAFNLKISTFRFFNVFGPKQRPDHQYAAVIPKWINAALNNSELEIYGDGEQTRDFTYVDDLINCLEITIEKELNFKGVVNLAFGTRISLNEILQLLTYHFPNLKFKYLAERTGDIRDSKSDPTNLRKLFGDLTHTTFEKALTETINWLK